MNDASRAQGWALFAAAAVAALLFVIGILNGSYWALAVPVAILTLFVLSLVAWVGYTIATIQLEADAAPEILSTDREVTPSTSARLSAPEPPTSTDRSRSTEDAA